MPQNSHSRILPSQGLATQVRGQTLFEDVTSADDIREGLASLRVRQSQLTRLLNDASSQHGDLGHQLQHLNISRARLGNVTVDARIMSREMLYKPTIIATQITLAVERLDVEQDRVKSTLDVVEQVAELKSCVLGVIGSMGAPQDWETAAEYLSRASRISKDVIDSGFAEQIVPTAEVPDTPRVTLGNAAESLCQLFLREFGRSAAQSDGAGITRFFKMFPMIGRSKEGLDAYGRYVCQGVALRARVRLQSVSVAPPQDGLVYANAITKLFEHIAQVIDGHSALVERHYGNGTMVKVMERLHREADVQAGIILDTWTDERGINRKLTDVKSYAFSFLVQSFLPTSRNGTGTPRSASPATHGAALELRLSSSNDVVDIKEVDKVLNEAGTMLSHWSLYLRFVSIRAVSSGSGDDVSVEPLRIPSFITDSTLPKKVAKILLEPFNLFATFFLRRSVERAFQLDENPAGLSLNLSKAINSSTPYITSAVDDVMYVVNQILQRALATSQIVAVRSIVSTIGRVLGSDFIGMIQRKMRDESFPRAAIQGALPPEETVISFLVLINNLDVATQYIKRIIATHTVDCKAGKDDWEQENVQALTELFPMNHDAAIVHEGLVNMESTFTAKANELVNDGLQVACQQILKPRLRPLLAEGFRDVDYSTTFGDHTRSMHAEDIADDITSRVKNIISTGWDLLIRPVKRILTESNFDKLANIAVAYLANLLEKRIWSYHGRVSEWGAIAMERDVSNVANIVSHGASFRFRENFARCLEITMILNLEEEEWEDLEKETSSAMIANGASTSSLTKAERERARTMIKGQE